MAEQAQGNAGHETRDINVRVVAWCALGLVTAAVIVLLSTAGLFAFFKREHPSPFAPSRITDPHPIAPETAPPDERSGRPGALPRRGGAEAEQLRLGGQRRRRNSNSNWTRNGSDCAARRACAHFA